MSPEIAALVGTLLGLVGGTAITYWGSVKLARKQSTALAAERLIQAFKDEILFLSNPIEEPERQGELLEHSFNKHYAAYIEFSLYLSKKEKDEFNKAWYTYYCYEGDPNTPYLEQYSEHLGSFSLAK